MATAEQSFNPEFDPTGIEGGLDTNKLPWIPAPGVEGMFLKPLRASSETGFFSVIVKLQAGTSIPGSVYLGGMDMLMLSGSMSYTVEEDVARLESGVFGYIAANYRTGLLQAHEDSELVVNYHGAVVFLNDAGKVSSMLTSVDVRRLARDWKIPLVPGTLAGCMQERSDAFSGDGVPLNITENGAELVEARATSSELTLRLPYFINTRDVPWVVNPAMPDVGLKIMRISEETGYVNLIVKHNGVADPHTHLGASDFLVLNGHIGYRAGPPEGYGPGVWFYEPPGARHDATQRIGDQDLIYSANLYGPLIFDTGRGTPVVAVLSWIEYKALAAAGGAQLIPSTFPEEQALVAWAPL